MFGLPSQDTSGIAVGDSLLKEKFRMAVEGLFSGPKCRTIIIQERDALQETNPRYEKLSEGQVGKREDFVTGELSGFFESAEIGIRGRLAKKGVNVPPRTADELDAAFMEIQAEVWKKFRHAPTTLQLNEKKEVVQQPDLLAGVVESLFEILDSKFSGKDYLDCKASLYLCADLMEILGVKGLSLVMLPKHVVLKVDTEEEGKVVPRYY